MRFPSDRQVIAVSRGKVGVIENEPGRRALFISSKRATEKIPEPQLIFRQSWTIRWPGKSSSWRPTIYSPKSVTDQMILRPCGDRYNRNHDQKQVAHSECHFSSFALLLFRRSSRYEKFAGPSIEAAQAAARDAGHFTL